MPIIYPKEAKRKRQQRLYTLLSFITCSIFGSTKFSSKNFKELQSEYGSVNNHIMQVLGWSIQDRKRS